MDDKLYYVEGPQGQVLGPMTMIQILEGTAAGAILERARICGVGEGEWIDLSDVAYTRHDNPQTPDAPDARETISASTSIWEAFEPAEEIPPAAMADEEPEGVEMSIAELEPAMFGAEAETAQAESMPVTTPESLPLSALPYDSSTEGDADFEVPAYVPEYAGAGPAATANEFEIDDAQEARGGRARWLVPILAGLGVPAVFGIYLLASGTLPMPGGREDTSPMGATATTAIPEMPPVAASVQDPAAEAWNGLHGEAGMIPRAPDAAPGAAADLAAPSGPSAAGSGEPIPLRFDAPLAPAPVAETSKATQATLDAAIDELSRLGSPTPAPATAPATPPATPPAIAPARRNEPEPTPAFERVAEPEPPSAPSQVVAPLTGPLVVIRSLLAAKDYQGARASVESARKDLAADPQAVANLDLWNAICDFEQGDLVDALARFEKLDRSASYAVSGFGAGAVANWIARVHFSSGDVRSAVGVLDEVGGESADEYAWARLWEGAALASLGMDELAERTWSRLSGDVGARVSPAGVPAVRTTQFLSGVLSEKQYRDAIGENSDWANDMHYFLGLAARRANNADLAREHFRRAMAVSRGQEFPYHVAEAEIAGEGLTGGW